MNFSRHDVGGFSDSLFRETIRNFLDAKADGSEPIRVLISVFRNVTVCSDPKKDTEIFAFIEKEFGSRSSASEEYCQWPKEKGFPMNFFLLMNQYEQNYTEVFHAKRSLG